MVAGREHPVVLGGDKLHFLAEDLSSGASFYENKQFTLPASTRFPTSDTIQSRVPTFCTGFGQEGSEEA